MIRTRGRGLVTPPVCLSVCLSECRSSARPHTTRAGLGSQVFRQPWDYIICLMMCLIPEIGPVCTEISFQPLSLYYSYFLCHAIFISLERKQEKTFSFCEMPGSHVPVLSQYIWYFLVHAERLNIFSKSIWCILSVYEQPDPANPYLYKKSLLMLFSPFISLSKMTPVSMWPFQCVSLLGNVSCCGNKRICTYLLFSEDAVL